MKFRNQNFVYKNKIKYLLYIVVLVIVIQAGCGSNKSNSVNTGNDFSNLVPIMDMSSSETYNGENGGLYGTGSNEPPADHLSAAQNILNGITPLDENGDSSSDGKIGFISIGMSNTSIEFKDFISLANSDSETSPFLEITNGAQVGMTAEDWAGTDEPWQVLEQRIQNDGLTNEQVQVAWVKLALAYPSTGWPQATETLKEYLITTMQRLKQNFPNIKIVYLSSRSYGGYALIDKNPEPYAYESGFAVRWLILDQINGSAELNFDPLKGTVQAPLLLWGPYLWANALTPRSDGLVWEISDFEPDGTHPNDQGKSKISDLLLNYLKTSELAKSWFHK